MLLHVSSEVSLVLCAGPHALAHIALVLTVLCMLYHCMPVHTFNIAVLAVDWTSMAEVDVSDIVTTLSLQLPRHNSLNTEHC